jgi:hypothetical protein
MESFSQKAGGLKCKRRRDDSTEWCKYLPSIVWLCAIAHARIQAPRGESFAAKVALGKCTLL